MTTSNPDDNIRYKRINECIHKRRREKKALLQQLRNSLNRHLKQMWQTLKSVFGLRRYLPYEKIVPETETEILRNP